MSNATKCSIKYHAQLDMPRIKSETDALMKSDPSLTKDAAMTQAAQSILSELQAQQSSVSENRLAPNGKPSNLNAVQYAQVRTPEFKKWFGDWENDPENASKVVDENGEPLVVYHGTKSDFNTFDIGSVRNVNMFSDSQGFYFTKHIQDANSYAESRFDWQKQKGQNIVPIYLNLKNPNFIDGSTFEHTYINPNALENYKAKGYDGLIVRDGDELIAFNPNQIKSATGNNGQFSTSNNDIRFSIAQPTDIFSSAAEIYRPTPFEAIRKLLIAKSKGNGVAVKLGLSAMTQNQIIDVGSPIFPIFKFFSEAGNNYDVEESKWHNIADKISEKWEKLAPNYKRGDKFFNKKWQYRNTLEQQRLARVMDGMTELGIDPRNPRPFSTDPYDVKLTMYDDLKDMYDTLLPNTKTLLNEIEKFHLDVFKETTDSMESKIQISEMPQDEKIRLISAMKAKFKKLSGPYFPLMRFGDFWVNSEDGFRTFESKQEQDDFRQAQEDAGIKIMGMGKNFDQLHKVEGVDISFIDSVNSLIDKSGIGDKEAEGLKSQMFQLYLSTLPESSMNKRFINRKNTPGWEQDALRSFAKKAFHDGKQLAKLKYAPVMRKVLNDADEIRKTGSTEFLTRKLETTIDVLPKIFDYLKHGIDFDKLAENNRFKKVHDKGAGFASEKTVADEILKRFKSFTNEDDRKKAMEDYFSDQKKILEGVNDFKANPDASALASDILEALTKSYDNMMTSNSSGWSRFINQGVFAFMLGFNPASAMVNMFQTPGVSLPVAAGRHGFVNASKELSKAYKVFFTNQTDKEFSIKGGLENDGERAMFEALSSNGTFDRTRGHDLAGLSEEGIARGTLHRDIMEASTFMFHKAEVANREITALMGYRLEFAKTGDVQKSIEYANNLVKETHLDYSSKNRPDLFQGNAARVFLQFKMYSQGMTYLWGKTAYDALISKNVTPERKAEARNIILSLVGVQISFAGILGLPIGGILMAAQMLVSFMDDDDDPILVEDKIRQALNAVVGNDIGRILAKGALSEVTKGDFAGRLGLSDLWIREPDRELEGKDEAYYLLKTIIGPSAGILEKLLIGMKFIGDGDPRRGVETMLPNSLAGVAKAYRSIEEGGATNTKGDMVYETNAYEKALQAIGMRPAGLEEQMAQNSAIKNRTDAIAHTKGKLLHIAVKAKLDNDVEAYNEAWENIKKFNSKYQDRRILPNAIAKSLKIHRKNQLAAKNGLIVKKKDRKFMEEEKII